MFESIKVKQKTLLHPNINWLYINNSIYLYPNQCCQVIAKILKFLKQNSYLELLKIKFSDSFEDMFLLETIGTSLSWRKLAGNLKCSIRFLNGAKQKHFVFLQMMFVFTL